MILAIHSYRCRYCMETWVVAHDGSFSDVIAHPEKAFELLRDAHELSVHFHQMIKEEIYEES